MSQLFDVLFDDLRSNKTRMNRLLGAGLLFALIAHFYVVEPYFEYKEKERILARSLSEKDAQCKVLSDRLTHLTDLNQKIKTNLKDIKDKIENFPEHLRGILKEIWDVLSSKTSSLTPNQSTYLQQSVPKENRNGRKATTSNQSIYIQQQIPDDSNMPMTVQQSGQIEQSTTREIGEFFMPPDITTFKDGVYWYNKTWFNSLINKIQNEIIIPINQGKIAPNEIGDIDLGNVAQQAMESINGYLREVNPEFWRTYSGPGGKIDVAQGLKRVVEESLGLVRENVDKIVEEIEKTKNKLDDELKTIKIGLTDFENRVKNLNDRLNSLESPLVRIPADLQDMIKLFPILIVALLVTITTNLRKGNSLYTALWGEFKKDNKESDYRVFQRHADCWYLPPYVSIFQPLLPGVLIAIIAGIFVRACFLVISEPSLFISLTGEPEIIRKNLFTGAYLVGSLVIIGCIWVTGKIFMRRF